MNREKFSNDPRGVIPMVVEHTARGERTYDIYSLLLKERIVFLNMPINPQTANLVVTQLIYLVHIDTEKQINLYISSPGGDIYSGLAIYDTIKTLSCDVATYSIGITASMATIILVSGTAGKRYALPNSTILIHQPWQTGGAGGQASDIDIQAKEIMRLRKLGDSILSKHTGKPLKQIEKDSDRDNWMSAQQAKEYGIVDEVLPHKK